MAESGIYEIVNLVNGKRYVGSAVNLVHRWRQHRCELGKGRHNPHLQNAWRKHGEINFAFRVIELVPDKERLIEREQYYIDTLKPEYNCAPVAGSNLGAKRGEETRARISAANRKTWECPEHRRKMSEAHKAYVFTDEHRAAISKGLDGAFTPEIRAKISAHHQRQWKDPAYRAKMTEMANSPEMLERQSKVGKDRWEDPEYRARVCSKLKGRKAHNKGKPMSAEQKAKQAETMRRKYAEDPAFRDKIAERTKVAMARPEVRAKVVAALTGRKQAPETVAKRAASNKGKKRTAEQRAAMSARTAAFYAAKRAGESQG